MNKKYFLPIMVLSLSLLFCACQTTTIENGDGSDPQVTGTTAPPVTDPPVQEVDFDFSDPEYQQEFWHTYLYWINWNYPLEVSAAQDLPDDTIVDYLHMIILANEGELTDRDDEGMIRLPLEKVQAYAETYLGIENYVPGAEFRNYDRETGEVLVQYWDLAQLQSGKAYWMEYYSMVTLQYVSPNQLVGTVQALDYGLEKPIESLRHYTFDVSDPDAPKYLSMELDWKLDTPTLSGTYENTTLTNFSDAYNICTVFGGDILTYKASSSAIAYQIAVRDENGLPTVTKDDVLDITSYGEFLDLRPLGDSGLLVKTTTHALKIDQNMQIAVALPLPEVVQNALKNWDNHYAITDDFTHIFYTTEKGAYGFDMKEGDAPVLLIEHPVIVDKDGDVTMGESFRYPTLMADGSRLTLRHVGYEWLCGLWALDVDAFRTDGTVKGQWIIEDAEQSQSGLLYANNVVVLTEMTEWEENGSYVFGYDYTGYDVKAGKKLFSLNNAGEYDALLTDRYLVLSHTEGEGGIPTAVDYELYDIETEKTTAYDFHAELTDNGHFYLLHVYDDGSLLVKINHPADSQTVLIQK